MLNLKDLKSTTRETLGQESNILSEGGNIFKTTEGGSETIRIKRDDVDPTLEWLENIVNVDLVNHKLGTTGKKETSGDLDLAIDEKTTTKDELVKKLTNWLIKEHPELDIEKISDPDMSKQDKQEIKRKFRQWVAKTGVSVHFKTPIRGDESNGFVQTDFMFGNPEFMLWSVKGEAGDRYKGRHRQLLINAIATQRGLSWSTFFGLKDRETGEKTNDPQTVVDRVLGPGYKPEDFDSIENLFDIISDKEKYPDDVYEAIREKAGFEFPHRDETLEEAKKIEPRIQHAEDLVFFEGAAGALRALEALGKMNDPEGRPETTLKWDGSPAVIFGRNQNGSFIFTDKSGFGAKSYKGKAESEDDIEQMYRARSERASEKTGADPEEEYNKRYSSIAPQMKKAFNLVEKSVDSEHKGYFFGEVLYFEQPRLEDGHYIFKPNMVKYKVKADSEMGEKIAASEVGIVLHLKKDVETLDNKPLNFDGLSPDPKILFFGKTFIEKAVDVNEEDLTKLKEMIEQNSSRIDEFFSPSILREKSLMNLPNLFYAYLNSKVDTGLEKLGSDFISWMEGKKTLTGQKKINVESYITENKEIYDIVWEIVTLTMNIKDDIVSKIDTQGGLPFSQTLGDEEVGEGYVLSDAGKLIKLVDRSKFTKANRAVVREENELDPDYVDDLESQIADVEDAMTHVFIPGGFKPPHKGHLSLLTKAIEKYPSATIHITSGPTERTEGDLEIGAEQAKQVWQKYIEKYGINNKVELDYFDRFETNRKKKDGSSITSASPFLRIGLRMENELEPNSTVVVVSPFNEHISFVKGAAEYLNANKGKSFTFEPMKVGLIEKEPGVKFSATQMRKAISENDFETFKTFMPEKLLKPSEDEAREIFDLLGGKNKDDLEEISGAGGVGGYAGNVGRKRKTTMKGTNYNTMQENFTHEENILKEYLTKKYIERLKPLLEQDTSDPKFKLGVNLTSRAFNDIKKNYLEPFNELLVTDQEKMSYMIHIFAKLGHVFIQNDVNLGLRNIALDKEFSDKLVSKGILTAKIAREAEVAMAAALEEREMQEAEEQIGLEIDDDDVVSEPEEKEEKEAPIEAPEEPITDLDQTGNNLAGNTLLKIKAQLLDDYNLIGPEEENKIARQTFIEYTFKNLIALTAAHWAGKPSMPEPLAGMYSAITSTSDVVKQPEVPEQAPENVPPAAPAEIPLEESDMQKIIKQSIIKTFRELNFS